MRIIGVASHLDLLPGAGAERHILKAAVAYGDLPSISVNLDYTIPLDRPRGPVRINTSEVIGIHGGVEDSGQRLVSEVAERNIGDATVFLISKALREIGQTDHADEPVAFVILGPPLPKVVGRIASLRPARNLQIAWFSSYPPTNWMRSFPGWSIAARVGRYPSKLWMEDEILVEESRSFEQNGFSFEVRLAWLNQYLSYEQVYNAEWVNAICERLVLAPWVDPQIPLPRPVALAALEVLGERSRVLGQSGSDPHVVGWASTVAAALTEPTAGNWSQLHSSNTEAVLSAVGKDRRLSTVERMGTAIGLEDVDVLATHWDDFVKRTSPTR